MGGGRWKERGGTGRCGGGNGEDRAGICRWGCWGKGGGEQGKSWQVSGAKVGIRRGCMDAVVYVLCTFISTTTLFPSSPPSRLTFPLTPALPTLISVASSQISLTHMHPHAHICPHTHTLQRSSATGDAPLSRFFPPELNTQWTSIMWRVDLLLSPIMVSWIEGKGGLILPPFRVREQGVEKQEQIEGSGPNVGWPTSHWSFPAA